MYFNLTLDESLLVEAPGDDFKEITSMDDYLASQHPGADVARELSQDGELQGINTDELQASVEEVQDALKDAEDKKEYTNADADSIFSNEQLVYIENPGKNQAELEQHLAEFEDNLKSANGGKLDKKAKKELDTLKAETKKEAEKTPKQKALELLYKGESSLGDFSKFGEGFQIALAESINSFGWRKSTNPYLEFAEKAKNTDVAKVKSTAAQALVTITNMLNNKELELSKNNIRWMTNKSAYDADDPVFKVKALTFINGKTADDFGDIKLVPGLTTKILDSRKKSDIEYLLQDWQTKDGTANDRRANNVYKQVEQSVKRGGIKYNPDKLRALFDKSFSEGDKPGETLQKMISSGDWKNIA